MDGFRRHPSRARRRYGKTLHVTTQPLVVSSRLSWLLVVAAPLIFANCSSNTDNTGGNGGSPASGGAASGGASTSSGGAASGGAASGGAASGGATGSGGASSGGASSGGAASGGAASGGAASGGASSGGQSGNSGGSGGGGGRSSGGAAGATGASGSSGAGGGGSGTFTLASADMMDGAKFDGKFTCNGGSLGAGINPELHWSGAPAGTMSFVITFIDTTIGANNSMGQHWAIYNVPATVTQLPQGLMKTLSGDLANAKQASPLGGYLAPCAQSTTSKTMDDQYEFTVYALSTATLNITGTSVANVLTALGVLPNGMLAS